MTLEEAEAKIGQAYQVIAHLIFSCDLSGPEVQRALDYFASGEYREDFLPWDLGDADREAREDARLLERARIENDPRDYLPGELVRRLLAGEHPLRIWREQRGLTLHALAQASGVGMSYISEIENGRKPGSVDALKKLAAALALSIDDLVR